MALAAVQLPPFLSSRSGSQPHPCSANLASVKGSGVQRQGQGTQLRCTSHSPFQSTLQSAFLPGLGHVARSRRAEGGRPGRRMPSAVRSAVRSEEDVDLQGESIAEDYYSVLGLRPEATPEEIKSAYYSCMKACHPDLSGNHPDSVAFCAFVNEVYEVLSDPEMRAVYDEIKGYSISAINPFQDKEAERDFTFVDEFTCIGCKNCANTAESTFEMEELWGRARVFNQRGDCPSMVQEAIDTCPVSCIHWVSASQLALLEDEMRRMERVSVGVMMAGQGNKGVDVFMQANSRWERRKRQAEEKARVKAAKERRRQAANGETPWGWDGPWWGGGAGAGAGAGASGKSPEASSEEEPEDPAARRERERRRPSKERMARAAEVARRWREYSQKGVDRRRKPLVLGDSTWGESAAAVSTAADGTAAAAAAAAAAVREEGAMFANGSAAANATSPAATKDELAAGGAHKA